MNFEDKILKAKEFDTEILTKLKEICEEFCGNLPLYDIMVLNGHISYIGSKNDRVVLNVIYNVDEGDFDNLFEATTFTIPSKYFNMTKGELAKEKIKLDESKTSYRIMIGPTRFSQIEALEGLERRVDNLEGITNPSDYACYYY